MINKSNIAIMFEAPDSVQQRYGKKYTVAVRTPTCGVGSMGKCFGVDSLREGEDVARLFGTVLSDMWGVVD